MTGTRHQRKPTFWWQSLLIVLPFLILAGFALVFLRQDKALTRQDAVEAARVIASELLPQIWNDITSTNSDRPTPLTFELNERGELEFPPAYVSLFAPRLFDRAALNPEQRRLWSAIQAPGHSAEELAAAVRDCRSLLASDPPRDFAADATYASGVFLLNQGDERGARDAWQQVIKQYADATGEGGVPLGPLAELKLLESCRRSKLAPPPGLSVEALASNVVCNPTALTPVILRQVEALPKESVGSNVTSSRGEVWLKEWRVQETVRKLYEAARPKLPTNLPYAMQPFAQAKARNHGDREVSVSGIGAGEFAMSDALPPGPRFWFYTSHFLNDLNTTGDEGFPNRNWLVVQLERPDRGAWFACYSESELGFLLSARVRAMARRIPDYFGVGLEVLGKPIRSFAPDLILWHHVGWFSPKSPGGGTHKVYSQEVSTEVLATAAEPGSGSEGLKLSVYLTSPTTLYERQQARAFWLGLLILASLAAALVGLFSAWRAFRQQLQLSELKSNFVSSVSHELRAPIASVRLLAESLERGKVPEPARQGEYYRFIVQECRRLTALVENVLDFSRIEQGRKQYEFATTDLTALVSETVRLMEPCAAEKGVKLELQTFNIQHSTFNAELEVDGRAIQQALVNLIDNAIKHSPRGEAVTVGTELQIADCGLRSSDVPPLNAQRATLNLFVSDHGPGIPKEEHEKIFERFYRRGSELRRETQGVGIGLSIVKHIVEAHGGRVRVESEVGKGSRFTIELPLSRQPRMDTDGHGY